jgi:starch-binding outer membrane protein, SusD/RagB family
MKPNFKNKILLGVVGLCLLSSCNKFLDESPDMRTELNSPEKVGELLATAYPQASYIPFTESMSDNVSDKGAGAVDLMNSSPYFFIDDKSPQTDAPIGYWNASYQAISAANHALEMIEKQKNYESYKAYKGEALVARAYAHFMLVTLFSKPYTPHTAGSEPGIPYVTTTEKVVLGHYQRKTVAYVYEMIEKDLKEGMPLINDAKYKVPKYHFTRAAANAFASRFYLFKQDYVNAIKHASSVYSSPSFSAYLRPVNSNAYRSYQYNELQAQYTRANNPANILLIETPSAWGRSYAGFRYGFTSELMSKLTSAPNVTGGTWAYNIYGNENTINIPKFREHFVRQTLNAESGIPYNMIPVLSSEEVLFNRAEANTMMGNFDAAIADLNDYIASRFIINFNIPVYTPDMEIDMDRLLEFYDSADREQVLINCILDFKRVNFLFEGQRWFDIIRHGLPVEHKKSNGEVLILSPTNPQRVFQLPEEVQSSGIQLNPR